MNDYRQLLACPDEELARIDPLVVNLLVAKSIPGSADLDLSRYEQQLDHWAEDVRQRLSRAEESFRRTPWDWKNDVNFFRSGVLCGYLECEAGIAYIESQREGGPVFYRNPADLFLNGVIDSRRGTCANMAALHVAIGWRLDWPVSLACVGSHFICRYDDGKVTHNIEATQAGFGGFKSDSDEYLIRHYRVSPKALKNGSELRALKPRELLGVFVGLRGRHMRDIGRPEQAEADYLLARTLFPKSRRLYLDMMALSVPQGAYLFDPGELGSPESLAEAIAEQYGIPRGGYPATTPAIRQVISTAFHNREES